MGLKGAIFDMDGTLLDSMGVWHNMTVRFLEKRGLLIDEESIEKFRDMTLEESLPLIVSMFRLPDKIEDVFAEFNALAQDEYLHHIPLKPYAGEYLKKLHSQGVKIAIATSGYQELCRGAMERLGLWDCVDAIALSSEVGVNKSNPDVYLLAAERVGVEPSECMVFEDILLGIQGAKKAGMQTTAVADEFSRQDWAKILQAADHAIESWEELL